MPVAELDRLVDVVGDEHDGLAEFVLQPDELVLQLRPDHRVDRGERLVHQHHRRIGGQRPGDADPLLLPAGKLGRVPLAHRRVQADPGEQFAGGGPGLPPALALQDRDGGDVVQHRAVREQAGVLDDVADARGAGSARRCCVVSLPSISTAPPVGSIIRLIIRSEVVLPQPDGPTNTVILPVGISIVRSSTAGVPSG